jgi:hypothetical protein
MHPEQKGDHRMRQPPTPSPILALPRVITEGGQRGWITALVAGAAFGGGRWSSRHCCLVTTRPWWYVPLCIGFDVVAGIYLLAAFTVSTRRPRHPLGAHGSGKAWSSPGRVAGSRAIRFMTDRLGTRRWRLSLG